jgi:arylsulfatase B
MRHSADVSRLVLVGAVAAACLASCSDPPADAAGACSPGATQGCVCPDGGSGAQACSGEGDRFLACVCEGEDPDPDGGQDVASDTASDTTGDTPEDVAQDVPDGGDDADTTDNAPTNVLLIIADDLGLDASECYGSTGEIASTPNIRALCEAGVVFNNAWVAPTCSPTRATMLTGRYPLRHGVGAPPGGDIPSLGDMEVTIPRVLNAHPELGVAHANIGKWHLTAGRNNPTAPNDFGWGYYSGVFNGAVPDFFEWTKTEDGEEVPVTNYATTELVDDAITWIGTQEGEGKPWVMWLAFNAPHTPFHVPPADLHSEDLGEPGPCPARENSACYRAAIEAMDAELGRLLGTLSPESLARTHIIYLGDNGTPAQVVQSPVERMRAKDSLYQGGIRVPFIVSGPAVVDGGRSVDAVIDASDVFASVLEMAGMDPRDVAQLGEGDNKVDSVSIVPYLKNPSQDPLRAWTLSELYASAGGEDRPGRAIRDDRFKLIVFMDGREELYDLLDDPWESRELIGAGLDAGGQSAYDDLKAVLEGLLAAP